VLISATLAQLLVGEKLLIVHPLVEVLQSLVDFLYKT
jgi:hypothetical protein